MTNSKSREYDGAVHRLQNLSSFNIQTLDDSGVPVDWWEVHPGELAAQVVVSPATVATDVMTIGVQLLEWSRHAARAQRVWEVYERQFRTWKARCVVEVKEAQPKATVSLVEAAYRTRPEYDVFSRAVERSAEAYNCANAVLEALRSKRDMLKLFVRRGVDGNPEILVA